MYQTLSFLFIPCLRSLFFNFRPGVVLGRSGGMIQQIFPPFYLGLGGRMGEGSQPLPWIHVKDLSGLVKHAVENDNVEGIYNAVAPQVIRNPHFAYSCPHWLGIHR